MAIPTGKLMGRLCFLLLLVSIGVFGKADPDCRAIQNEVNIFKSVSPAGVSVFKRHLTTCNIHTVNGFTPKDYFKTEHDTLLTLAPMAIHEGMTHPVLLNYLVNSNRWDFLLTILDTMRKYDKITQINILNELFYKNLPNFFNAEIKEMFNFFSEAEKIAVAQQLIPTNANKIKQLNQRNDYIVEFWPLFDQMAYISHLREIYPDRFERLSLFWKEKLISYYYEDIENQDPTFKLLNNLLTKDIVQKDMPGVNPSFQVFYYMKTNQFNLAKQSLAKGDKQVFFNILRYFELFSPAQQAFLLNHSIQLSISDIQMLFEAYYHQIGQPNFQKWVWANAVNTGFNMDNNVKRPYQFFRTMPHEFDQHLATLSPINYAIKKNKRKIKLNFYKKKLTFIHPDYESFSQIPRLKQQQMVGGIIDVLPRVSHNQFMRLIPHIPLDQQIEFIGKFKTLERIPTKNRRRWTSLTQPKLQGLSNK